MPGIWNPFDMTFPVSGPQTAAVGTDIDTPIVVQVGTEDMRGPFHLRLRLESPSGEKFPLQGHLEVDDDELKCCYMGGMYCSFMLRHLRFLKTGTHRMEIEAWTEHRRLGSRWLPNAFEVVPGPLTPEQEEANKPTESQQRWYIDPLTGPPQQANPE
ncbi:hypothetical protein MAPG_09255 [Magnaporthiopsis poae ATCC 64411]|uniref:Uncharacterized protein n=1 Tax=Magnaporthiopsis poae (strain ATCC 64411 / 73-15) TaxID=644358 RepID=A0A0C4E9H0_MAGP6|nr:hypothetical protein MAPG_09255 [Magnaporthiopsis poae ATCC 64411]